MSCPKCKDAQTPFCGVCGSKIPLYKSCSWCNATNDAENSYCAICGRKFASPFSYSKKVKTQDEMLREVLSTNTTLNDKRIGRYVSKAEYYCDCRCPECGEIEDVAGVRQRDIFGFLGNVGISMAEGIIQQIGNPDMEVDAIEETIGLELLRTCLVCGNVW